MNTDVWREMYNELYNLCSSPHLIRQVRRIVHVTRIKDIRNEHYILYGSVNVRDHLKDLPVDGKTI